MAPTTCFGRIKRQFIIWKADDYSNRNKRHANWDAILEQVKLNNKELDNYLQKQRLEGRLTRQEKNRVYQICQENKNLQNLSTQYRELEYLLRRYKYWGINDKEKDRIVELYYLLA